jgi:hypothetical protein
MSEAVVTGIAGFAAYLLVVIVLLRVMRAAPSVIATGASLVVYVGTVILSSMVMSHVWFWPLSAVYWFLALCFLMIFGALYKSISFRVLLDLSLQPQHADRYDAILGRYIEGESYQDRIRVLLASGLAHGDASGLRLTSKGRRLSALLDRLQKIYKIERSG